MCSKSYFDFNAVFRPLFGTRRDFLAFFSSNKKVSLFSAYTFLHRAFNLHNARLRLNWGLACQISLSASIQHNKASKPIKVGNYSRSIFNQIPFMTLLCLLILMILVYFGLHWNLNFSSNFTYFVSNKMNLGSFLASIFFNFHLYGSFCAYYLTYITYF